MMGSAFSEAGGELSVLVVEDEPSLQRLLAMSLARFTTDFTVVGTAAGALDHLSERSYAALACDVGLPDQSGLEVIELARRNHRSMGIVAMTGMADVQTAVSTMKAGGDDFLTKPFNPDMLWHVLRKSVEGRRLHVEADQAVIYRKLAYTDALTNCPNRRFVEEQLTRDIEASSLSGQPLTVGFLDIDNFKLFNDFLGHTQGDRVLGEVADRLRRCVHAPASFGRFGGDEFVLILPGMGAAEVGQTMARIRSEVASIDVSSNSNLALVTQVSIGLSTHHPGCTPRELVAEAETSMHLDKAGAAFRDGLAHIGSGMRDVSNLKALRNLVKAIDRRDAYTRFHSDHATSLAIRASSAVGLEGPALTAISVGGPVHDLGKIVVPDEILRKPGRLTAQERAHMEEHPVIGAAIAAAVSDADVVVDLVRHHHERFDGRGYPGGLKGDEISLPTRLFTLSDAYSAMTTDRPYRRGLSTLEALEEIRLNKGTQFDPDLADIFIDVVADENGTKRAA
jgi:diguanylate cyclase (GGDEF)-like protein